MDEMRFIDRYKKYCADRGTSAHLVAQETGENTGFVSEWMAGKRTPRADRAMEALKKFANSPTLGLSFAKLAAWWAMDYLPPESFIEGVKDLSSEDKALLVNSLPAEDLASLLPDEMKAEIVRRVQEIKNGGV